MTSIFAAIDLKSFYASVECVERGLDPLTTNLVVADQSRTEKTICLAVSPSMKAYGLPGRCRLFEVVQKAREVRAQTGKALEYIVAPPRMRLYMNYSARIYEKVYLKYIAPEDIHVYSIDEVMIDLTRYLALNGVSAHELVRRIIGDILAETGITATAGIGTNLYLAKIAMDIVAKHVPADEDGVRIAELDEMKYRHELWGYQPLTKFWRVGQGISRRLEKLGIRTMGELARRSLYDEDSLYREFGVDAELLIDHAWGVEPCSMADIKRFRPENNSVSVGQVLSEPYSFEKGRLIVQEMTDQLALELVAKHLVADGVALDVGYDREAVDRGGYTGRTEADRYGRRVPKPAHGSAPLTDAGGARVRSSSTKKLIAAMLSVYDRIVDPALTVRRFYVVFTNVIDRDQAEAAAFRQMDMFTDAALLEREKAEEQKEERMQHTMLRIKDKYGKNAILKGMNLQEGATARERNRQVGGHASGTEE